MDINDIIIRIKKVSNKTDLFDSFFRPNHGHGPGPIKAEKLLQHLHECEETVHVYIEIVGVKGAAFCFSWTNSNDWVEPGATKRKLEFITSSIARALIKKLMPQVII